MIQYDAAGNLVKDHRGYTYEWDYENHLTKITKDDGSTVVAEYIYDALGRRVRKVDYIDSSLTCEYYYNGWQLLSEKYSGDTKYFAYGNYLDEVVMETSDDGLYLLIIITLTTICTVQLLCHQIQGLYLKDMNMMHMVTVLSMIQIMLSKLLK